MSPLTHLIRAGWAKKLKTSVLAFDIAQFFLSLNHMVLHAVIAKSGFPPMLGNFFASCLVGSKIMYWWNNTTSGLSSILSRLYISLVMKLFKLSPISREVHLLSYVNDSTFLGQSLYLNDNLSCSVCYERTFILSFSILSYLTTGYLI